MVASEICGDHALGSIVRPIGRSVLEAPNGRRYHTERQVVRSPQRSARATELAERVPRDVGMASSRFWAAGESSDDDEGSAESESEPEKVVKTATRWATVSDSESSDEGDKQRALVLVNLLHATHCDS